MSQDWWVDATISGGNGTDPASAYPSVTSITWGAGDRAWIRQTHIEALNNSIYLGPNSLHIIGFSRNVQIFGWPRNGDPGYDVRPARGTTVGWDGDTSALAVMSNFGLPFPMFTTSAAVGGGIIIGPGSQVYNVCLSNSIAGTNWPVANGNNFTLGQDIVLDNVCVANRGGAFAGAIGVSIYGSYGKLYVANSAGANPLFSTSNFRVAHLVIASGSVTTKGVFQTNGTYDVGLLEVLASSISNIFFDNLSDLEYRTPSVIHVRRIAGTLPYSAAVGSYGAMANNYTCDDYYGQGAIQCPALNQPRVRIASIDEANHNSLDVVAINVTSWAAGAQFYWGRFAEHPIMRSYLNVATTGTIKVEVPIYVDSTAAYSMTAGMVGRLLSKGAGPQFANSSLLLPGSPTLWNGSLISGGSAWIFRCQWTNPDSSPALPFEFYPGPFLQATSGTGLKAYTLFGQPYLA